MTLNVQNAKEIQIPEGEVRTIHDEDKKLIWGKVQYDTKYMGDLEQVNYSGKNLFNYQGVVDLALSGTGGGTVQSQTTYRSFYWKVSAGDVYTISRATSSGNNRCRIAFTMVEPANGVAWYGQYGVQGANYYDAGSALSITITVPQNMEYAILYLSNQDDDITESLHYQVELGSTATTYEPYVGGVPSPNPDYPQPINVVKGTQTIDIYGKNMLNVPNQTLTSSGVTWVWKNGKVTVSATSASSTSSYACQSSDINIVKGYPYVFSLANTTTVNITLQGQNNGSWETIATIPAGSISVPFVATKGYSAFMLSGSGWTSGAAISTSINGVQLEVCQELFNNFAQGVYATNSVSRPIHTGVNVKLTASAKNGFVLYDIGAVSDYVGAKVQLSATFTGHSGGTPRAYLGIADSAYNTRTAKAWLSSSGSTWWTVEETSGQPRLVVAFYAYNDSSVSGPIGANCDYTDVSISVISPASPYEAYQHSTKEISLSSKNLLSLNLAVPIVQSPLVIDGQSDNSLAISIPSEATANYLAVRYIIPLANLGLNVGDVCCLSATLGGTYASYTGTGSGTSIRISKDGSGDASAIIKTVTNATTDFSFTIPAGITSLGFFFYICQGFHAEANSTASFSNIQLEVGSTATAYEPYHIVLGKNLFNGQMELGIINGNTGKNGTNNNYTRCKDYIAVDALTSYSISSPSFSGEYFVYEYKADYSYNLTSNKHTPSTFTTESGTAFVRFRPNALVTGTPLDTKYQFEKGSPATSYEPYAQTPLELAGLTQAQDYFYYSNGIWTIRKGITTVTVTGSEYWTKLNSAFQTSTGTTPGAKSTTAAGSACSDYFIYYPTQSSITSNIPDGQFGWNTSLALTIRNDSCADAAAFKTWLAAHPTTIYYPLATAADTVITYPSLVAQLEAIRDWMIRAGYTQTVVGDLPIIINKEDL